FSAVSTCRTPTASKVHHLAVPIQFRGHSPGAGAVMAEPYTIVIGLEVHVQLLTKTKLFCGCRNQFGLPPNTATCPVCLGLPGSLPVMNRTAFDLALRAALALNCE